MDRVRWRHVHRFARLFAVAVLLGGCKVAPSVMVLHNPIQPNNTQTVTYTATARHADGVDRLEIWEDVNTLGTCPNGLHCATRVSTTLLTTCTIAPATVDASCEFTTTAAHPDGSFIGYRAVAHGANGTRAADGWIYYAAGAFPWPDEAIPVYATGAPVERVDLVFIPDPDYAGDNNMFIRHASLLLSNGFMAPQPFADYTRRYRGLWNFYVTYTTGDAQGFGTGCNTAPANWSTLRAIVNSGAIVHTADFTDCSGIGDGSLSSFERGAYSTAVHEAGHSVFSLADEYCCNGGYWETSPHPNVFDSQAGCQANATSRGWPTTDCVEISDGVTNTGKWRSDGADDLMVATGALQSFGRSDRQRVRWLYFAQCLGAPGC